MIEVGIFISILDLKEVDGGAYGRELLQVWPGLTWAAPCSSVIGLGLASGSRIGVRVARLVAVLVSVLLMVSTGMSVSESELSRSCLVLRFGSLLVFDVVGLGVGRPCSELWFGVFILGVVVWLSAGGFRQA